MSLVHCHVARAADGRADALEAALKGMFGHILAMPGAQGVELMRDRGDPGRFVAIERWASAEALKLARQTFTPELMAPVLEALGEPLQTLSLDVLKQA